MFGSPNRGLRRVYPKVLDTLREHGGIIFEAPTLVKFPRRSGGLFYQKGVALELVEPDLIHVGALMVRHPGQEIDAAGVSRGWFHRVDENGVWLREPCDDDCPCGSDWPHERHLDSLHIVERFLTEPVEFDE